MTTLLTNKDYIPIKEFELKWRFTDSKHNLLPEQDLALIQPLSKDKAKDLDKYSRKYLGNATLLKSEFSRIETFQISDDHDVARSWLEARQIEPRTRIFISWDNSSCAVTRWDVFCKYWDAFCYPSSDDILIWRDEGDWFLYYCHHNHFEFGIKTL